ncbi:hypothetical protein LSH36_785g02004 [Paralvinella palmiformis]|uniref:CS domain-containing protein n=1 Tax=Paralvinella palmiformis TaxID=53620 RepID=A0AAD9J115_9ANNE|nr:hypothetical protein LSH36_785g02004 [Paralvinella palmiformis]
MAEGKPPEGRFPPEVLLRDNDPSNGYYTIVLTIPDLKVKTSWKRLKKVNEIENGEHRIDISQGKVLLFIKIQNRDKTMEYKYEKKLPEDINTLKSDIKIRKEEVRLILCKKENISWGQYSDHFMSRS